MAEPNVNEQEAMRELRSLRFKAMEEGGEPSDDSGDDDEDTNAFAQALRSFRAVQTRESRIAALREGYKLGRTLREKIESAQFDGFLVALVLAVIKDFGLDLVTILVQFVPIIGQLLSIILIPALNLLITVALLMIIMFQGIWFKRLIRRARARFIVPMFAEAIPILNYFPWYTVSVLLIKRKADEVVHDLEAKRTRFDQRVEMLRRG